jgi:hypothetical protein
MQKHLTETHAEVIKTNLKQHTLESLVYVYFLTLANQFYRIKKVVSREEKAKIDRAVVQWLLKRGLPLSIIREEDFRELFEIILHKEYHPPGALKVQSFARLFSAQQEEAILSFVKCGCTTATLSFDGLLFPKDLFFFWP